MKKVILFLFALNCAVNLMAQSSEIFPVDWKAMKKFATEHPDSVRSLVKRMVAQELDTTLTYEQRRLAFYGQSYIINRNDADKESQLHDLYKDGKYKKVVECANSCLEINPLNLEALNYAYNAMANLRESGDTLSYSQDEIMYYGKCMMRIFNTIATTGDGSKQHPFYVTAVSDEYKFMRVYLDLREINCQFIVTDPMPCDGFKLKKTSQYYDSPEIYFEISRVFELESEGLF